MAKSRLSLGCLFWLALILLVLVVIIANLKTANEIIQKTGFDRFVSDIFTKQNVKDGNETGKSESTDAPNATGDKSPVPTEANPLESTPIPIVKSVTPQASEPKPAPTAGEDLAKDQALKSKPNIRNAKIYFIKPSSDGTTTLKAFIRQVRYADEPLLETMLALLRGPSESEAKSEYVSMIPQNTKIRRIYVKENVAYLDFNEDVRFNSLGKEGQKAQVAQLVYTSTEFSNVKAVSILVEGEKVDFLGPEGIYIGKPLSREDCAGL